MFIFPRFLVILGILFSGGWTLTVVAFPLDKMPPERLEPAPSISSFLLVASPQMPDPRFQKTVILVTKHGNSGPIGVIVNRPENITLDTLFPAFNRAKFFRLFAGGPVLPRQISYLVRGGETVAGTIAISSNLYLAYDLSKLGELLDGKLKYTDLRVVHGLASWAPGQLEDEIRFGGWFVMPLDDTVIFGVPPEKMWDEMNNRRESRTNQQEL